MGFSLKNWFASAFPKKCDECLKMLELILDDEATTDQKKYFAEHIENCQSCYEYYHLEKTIKQVLREKVLSQPAPSDLVDMIRTKVRQDL